MRGVGAKQKRKTGPSGSGGGDEQLGKGRAQRPPVRVHTATPSEFPPRRGPQNSPGASG
jgi:hypothetical protein